MNYVFELPYIEKISEPNTAFTASLPGMLSLSSISPQAIINFTGTTSSELQDAINDASNGDVIKIVNSFNLSETVIISAGKNITIKGATGNEVLTTSDILHFRVEGSLTLESITLDGGGASGGVYVTGGAFTLVSGSIKNNNNRGVSVSGGSFSMEGGSVSGNTSEYGSGVLADNNSSFYMSGGIIGGNTEAEANIATNYGGGVGVYNGSQFVMSGGSITGNRVTGPTGGGGGGGIFLINGSTFILNDGVISNNTATAASGYNSYGGGVLLGTLTYVVGQEPTPSAFLMNGGIIENNEAKYVGGGVAVLENSRFNMNDGIIRGNLITTGNGGGGVFVGRAVFAGGVSFVMTGGEIIGNYGTAGGGVLVEGESTGPSLFTMTGGEISGNHAASYYGGGVCLLFSYSEFIMGGLNGTGNPVIKDNVANSQGGGVFLYSSSITMYNGEIFGNRAGSLGGGVCLYAGSRFGMEGGMIGGETATDANVSVTSGGGVATYAGGNIFTMNGGRIIGNIAESTGSGGGGVYIGANDRATISGEIGNNIASANDGGGIYISSGAEVEISRGTVNDNSAAVNGGGIYVAAAGKLTVSGTSFIVEDNAGNEGGGIYTADYTDYANLTANDYQNITTENTVVFRGNSASAAYEPPAIVATYTNIGYASTSIMSSRGYVNPINNYDINYINPPRIDLYTVTYDANGGSGMPPVDDLKYEIGAIAIVMGKGELERAGYTFIGWNTAPNGGGTSYQPSDAITITGNLLLYAQWNVIEKPVYPPTCHMPCCPCFIPCCMICCKCGNFNCKSYCKPHNRFCVNRAVNYHTTNKSYERILNRK